MRLTTLIYENPELAAIGFIVAAVLGRVTPPCLVQSILAYFQ